jgi:hypothetical protein
MRRAGMAAIGVVLAAVVGVATALATGHSSWEWWAAFGVLAVVGVLLLIAAIARRRRWVVRQESSAGSACISIRGTGDIFVSGSDQHVSGPSFGDDDSPARQEGLGGDKSGD